MNEEEDMPRPQWIKLKEGKEFSRLLYPNPVCFLTTRRGRSVNESSDTFASSSLSLSAEGMSSSAAAAAMPAVNDTAAAQTTSSHRNVMVLSWLTATNNSGRFMFSLNRRRHTASTLAPDSETTGIEFVLSVPVQGMEQQVLDVGGTSGRFGSKFPSDHNKVDSKSGKAMKEAGEEINASKTMSKRQRKKLKKEQFAQGIPGLASVAFGNSSAGGSSSSTLFGIQGTVAHLKCRTYSIVSDPPDVIDADHHLVMAEVVSAFVHPSYWDPEKNQFRPLDCVVPPYLTFFGAQTFGYVTNCEAERADRNLENNDST